MTKMLRVDDDVHEIVTRMAAAEDRKITPFLNRHFRELAIDSWGELGVPNKTTPSPKNTETIGFQEASDQNPAPHPDFRPGEKIISEAKASPSVSDLFAEDVKHVPDVTVLEQACCLNENVPCKHWVWDSASGEGYKNILSGRFMEVE